MITAIDTNVISSIWSAEPNYGETLKLLNSASSSGTLVISPVVYVELFSHPTATRSFVYEFLNTSKITIQFQLPEAVWHDAGSRFTKYSIRRRKSGGRHPKRLLADFIIGAHALLCADRLITLDRKRFRRDFPELHMM